MDMKVEEGQTLSAFAALEPEWNTLAAASGSGPFQRHECVSAWISSFGSGARLVVLTGRDRAGRLVAALPLLAEIGVVCGVPARLLVGAANTHSCRFDLIAEDPKSAGRAFLAFLLSRPGWDLLRIIDVTEGGKAWAIHQAAIEAGLPVGAWESERSPYLSLPSSYAEVLATKSPLFRANLRRRRRQLERLGTLTVERVTGGPALLQRLEEGFALEQRGWKGREGTAIAQDPRTRAFYTDFAIAAARHGYLSLFFLRLNGKAIAFHYGLVHDGIYYVPKLAYDDSLKGCSPGLVMLEEAIRDAIARGLSGYDFLGAEAEWKNRWSSTTRPGHWLFIFRDTRFGRALRKAKFEWVPSARRALSRVERTWRNS
ncbi:MAG: GNAT family N-acetyltransferase [Vicinamibacteria bacterium]|nr:GNAT family N-acetyltransferase [Vicinamibacteria bacterium]